VARWRQQEQAVATDAIMVRGSKSVPRHPFITLIDLLVSTVVFPWSQHSGRLSLAAIFTRSQKLWSQDQQ